MRRAGGTDEIFPIRAALRTQACETATFLRPLLGNLRENHKVLCLEIMAVGPPASALREGFTDRQVGSAQLPIIIARRFRLIHDLLDFEPLQAGRHFPLDRISESISQHRRPDRCQD